MSTGRQIDRIRRRLGYYNLRTPDLAIPEHADLHARFQVVRVEVGDVRVWHGGEAADELVVDIKLRVL